MDEMRKKKLLMEYKYRKPEMGVFVFECIATGKSYIGCSNDIKARLNRNQFQLEAGMHPNKKLQNDWKNHGESNFSITVLEVLPYDKKDETKTDYTEELERLRDQWMNKMPGAEAI